MLFGANRPKRVAVFISGSGSTLQALLDSHHDLGIQLIVTHRKNALGVLKAKRFGKSIFYFSKDLSFDYLQRKLLEHQIDAVFLAGFMKVLPVQFLNSWKGRILNIHPSLLPLFPGLEAAEKSFKAQQNMGVSIHEVIEKVDAGKLHLQMQSLSAKKIQGLPFAQAELYLRKTEQHLLREVSNRWKI